MAILKPSAGDAHWAPDGMSEQAGHKGALGRFSLSREGANACLMHCQPQAQAGPKLVRRYPNGGRPHSAGAGQQCIDGPSVDHAMTLGGDSEAAIRASL